jgi:hypothetical protein
LAEREGFFGPSAKNARKNDLSTETDQVQGANWPRARAWLSIPAFLVMSVGCLTNAARCGRLHCYVTAPLFFLAALYVALGQAHVVPLHPAVMLDAVACVTLLSFGTEYVFGRYRNPE